MKFPGVCLNEGGWEHPINHYSDVRGRLIWDELVDGLAWFIPTFRKSPLCLVSSHVYVRFYPGTLEWNGEERKIADKFLPRRLILC